MNDYQYIDEKGDYIDYWELVNENGEFCKQIEDLQQRIDKAIDDIDKIEKDIINNTIIGFNQFVPAFNKIKNNLKGE